MVKATLESKVVGIKNNPCYDEEKHGLLLGEMTKFLGKLGNSPLNHIVYIEPWANKPMMDIEICNQDGESFTLVLDEGLFHWEASLDGNHFFEENVPYSEGCFDEISEIVNKNF